MPYARRHVIELARLLLTGLTLAQAACGDDSSDTSGCKPTLEEWCMDRCEGFEDLASALETGIADGGNFGSIQGCGPRVIVTLSGGFVGSSYIYDSESGELLGASSFTDQLSTDECTNAARSAGESTTCPDEGCALVGQWLSDPDSEACEGPLADQLIDECIDSGTTAIEGCEACACEACFPRILFCDAFDDKDRQPGVCPALADECVMDRCADACGM